VPRNVLDSRVRGNDAPAIIRHICLSKYITRSDSDVDVLVVFQDDAQWSLFDHMQAEEELQQIFGREVDLVEKKAIRDPFRRHHILSNYEVIYAA